MRRRGVRGWFRLPVADRQLSERDVSDELATHIDERVERLMAQGMSEEEARAEAERRLGGAAQARWLLTREAWDRDVRLSFDERLRGVLDDMRYVVRSVFRERGYALVVIITLALGIGANATMFGLLDRLLLSGPAHVERPEQLYRFYANVKYASRPDTSTFSFLNGPLLAAFRERVSSLEHVSGYTSRTMTLGAGAEARRLDIGGVSASFFDLAGVRPALGRFFDAGEDAPPAGQNVIVISHGLWQSDLAGRADILGETLLLSGVPYTIVGVAPPGFTGVELEPRDGWVPLATAVSARMGPDWLTEWGGFYMPIVGRLRPGASPERAAAEATAAWRHTENTTLLGPSAQETRVSLGSIRADQEGREPMEARVARWLMAVAIIVLLVACANVANLYFARGLKRRREIAVRLALGISRGRLIRLLLLESMLLAVLGGIAAIAIAHWGAEIVRNVLLPNVDWTTSPINLRVLAVAAGLTALVGLLTGLAPAFMATSTSLASSLTGSVHAPPAPGRARNVLAAAQAAFCVLLLVGAGVFVRSLWSVHNADLGVDADRVLAVTLEWQTPPDLSPEAREQLSAQRRVFFTDAADRIEAIAGVEHSAAAIGSVFSSSFGGPIRVEGIDSIPSMPGGGPYLSGVGPGYFATLGTPVLRGREFRRGEGAGTDPVIIVSRLTAETLWPDRDPLGQCVMVGDADDVPCSLVVGVVGDVRRFRIEETTAMQFYVPLGQQPAFMVGTTILARTSIRPSAVREPLRRVLYGMEPTLRYVNVRTFGEYLEPQRRPWKLGAVLFAFCGGLALAIAMIGLYSVIAYLVLHRGHEIGVRMALGARREDIMRMVVRQALTLAGAGVLIGTVIALIGAPYLQPLLFQTQARDIAIFAITALTLGIAALAAGVVPALRASRIAPTEALRET